MAPPIPGEEVSGIMGKRNNRQKHNQKSKQSSPDKAEKILEDYADVFADIINVLVYDGKEVVKLENLADGPTASMFKAAEGNWGQKDRDVIKLDVRNHVTYALYGLENQTAVNYVMPVRSMGYDYASYEKYIRDMKAQNKAEKHVPQYAQELWPDQRICPVVTLVLYFGTTPWTGPTTLHEMMNLPEELKPYVPDYKINLVQVSFLEEETIAKFQSDFRIVAEYFRSVRLGNEKETMYNKDRTWDHVEELMEFFRTFASDRRFGDFKQLMIDESRKGEVTMCTLLDAFEKEGMEKGIVQGRQEGLEQGLEQGITQGLTTGRYQSLEKLMKNTNMSITEAMNALDFSDEEKSGYEQWKSDNKTTT